jgi:hypothetical protein
MPLLFLYLLIHNLQQLVLVLDKNNDQNGHLLMRSKLLHSISPTCGFVLQIFCFLAICSANAYIGLICPLKNPNLPFASCIPDLTWTTHSRFADRILYL